MESRTHGVYHYHTARPRCTCGDPHCLGPAPARAPARTAAPRKAPERNGKKGALRRFGKAVESRNKAEIMAAGSRFVDAHPAAKIKVMQAAGDIFATVHLPGAKKKAVMLPKGCDRPGRGCKLIATIEGDAHSKEVKYVRRGQIRRFINAISTKGEGLPKETRKFLEFCRKRQAELYG